MKQIKKAPNNTEIKEFNYDEIIELMKKKCDIKDAYPNTFAIKVNSIFKCEDEDE